MKRRGARLTLDLKCALPSPPAAVRHEQLVAVARQVANQLAGVGIAHHGAERHLHNMSSPERPVQSPPPPCAMRGAERGRETGSRRAC